MCRLSKLIHILSFAMTLLVVSFCSSVLAVAVPQTTEQLVSNSSDVIRGNVLSQKSQWDENHTVIYTEVRIEITEVVLGSVEKGKTILVYVPGGVVNDTGLKVEHAPSFENGEEVILFLTELDQLYSVTSWEMGKFTVQDGKVREENILVTEFIDEIKVVKR